MLTELNVQNLATLSSVDLELGRGCIAITGDTGAGKSLILEALELALGGRADSGLVRQGTHRAEITASFNITNLSEARVWLLENEFDLDDELILRRTLSSEGRSKAFVNGTPITTSQLKALSDCLVFMHTQHANQKLLQPQHQLRLLDDYADKGLSRRAFSDVFEQYIALNQHLESIKMDAQRVDSERELLTFQVDELDALSLGENELAVLEQEQKKLSSGDTFIRSTESILDQLQSGEREGVLGHVDQMIHTLNPLVHDHEYLVNAEELLNQAQIALSEAKTEIQRARDRFELDPERLAWVEDRLGKVFQLARKHKIEPENLFAHHQMLITRLNDIQLSNDSIPSLENEIAHLLAEAQCRAEALSIQRRLAAKDLSEIVTSHCPDLGMEYANFEIRFEDHGLLGAHGLEHTQFVFQPNPGQTSGSLSKIASGGELSRISLAIQVAAASKLQTPTLVFDEVDIGIGGRIASKVGELLNNLANNVQILVVTHQPQVAGLASEHLHVQKNSTAEITQSSAKFLTRQERIEEISRMLGGHNVTNATRQAASELLRY